MEREEEDPDTVEFEGMTMMRYFPNADEMNADPDKFVEGMSTDNLELLVKFASFLYYNYEGGGLTDNTFDAFEYHLNKRLKYKGRRYEKIGAPPLERIRCPLPYPLGSLRKVKPGTQELIDFISTLYPIVWSLKLDGVSGMIVYKDGEVSSIYTRGDGTIGGDVTFLKDYIIFPSLPEECSDLVVRGEFIMKREVWESKYQDPAGTRTKILEGEKRGSQERGNCRAVVNGKIHSGFVTDALYDIDFLAYQIIAHPSSTYEELPTPYQSFKLLEALGFNVPDFGLLSQPTTFDLIDLYKSKREISRHGEKNNDHLSTSFNSSSRDGTYIIDGLVLTLDVNEEEKKGIRVREGKEEMSVAFKMRLEDQVRETKVISIDWNITRYGRMVPVVNYESVYMDGSRLHRASAYNAAHIRNWSMGKGTKIKVVRSGDVIPVIVDVEVDRCITPIYPQEEPSWHWQGQDIVLDDIENNRDVQIKRMVHFFTVLGVPRLRDKTLEKLWDAGYNTIDKIIQSQPKDFIRIKGIGMVTANNHYNNIHRIMRTTRVDRYMMASSFQLGIGRKLIKQVMKYYPNIFLHTEEEIRTTFKRIKIAGIGPKRIEVLATGIPNFREFLFP